MLGPGQMPGLPPLEPALDTEIISVMISYHKNKSTSIQYVYTLEYSIYYY